MDLKELIDHPERMNKETLYELRELTALHPYFQTARLLMLQNLYLLHESSFDEELRRAALFVTDRTRLFDMVEARHYRLRQPQQPKSASADGDRTLSLIDDFLGTLQHDDAPATEATASETPASEPPAAEPPVRKRKRRKPTAADATVDYAAYLQETDGEAPAQESDTAPMRGQGLIDKFINDEGGRIQLHDTPEYTPPADEGHKNTDEGYFTATLARIYIKQGRYSKALEIIKRLNLNYPKKSAYFADQIRFLEKLIINNNKK